MNKKKIFNDPVYGFITIKSDLIFDIIQHPVFQRLRRIKQLGLTELVYPGAHHTRFQHAIGATHLMTLALDTLRAKGIPVTDEEYEQAQVAILLHDIGHGPFSHALERSLLQGVKHESLSFLFMKSLNEELDGRLSVALRIFQNTYHKKFLHQLVSSQLDVDRLDYLRRDSFFTGVSEGSIGLERIIAMLNVADDKIVIEEKGLHSIENFLNARRLMYWQVYLHKTSVSAEKMLIRIILRAKELALNGYPLPGTKALKTFLTNNYRLEDFQHNKELSALFARLDDCDIWAAIKCWQDDKDTIISTLSKMLLERKLFGIVLGSEPLSRKYVEEVRGAIARQYKIKQSEVRYFFSHGDVSNKAYMTNNASIDILTKKGAVVNIADAADLPNIKAISEIVKKYYLCFPKNVYLHLGT